MTNYWNSKEKRKIDRTQQNQKNYIEKIICTGEEKEEKTN